METGIYFISIIILLIASFLSFYFYLRYIICNENPKIWEKKVKKIESRYNETLPHDRILFIGSSSIEYWKTLEADMLPLKVLNHGIAGTKIADITFYANRLITPFRPKAIVFYAGANDINGIKGNSKNADQVFQLTIDFFSKVQSLLPGITVYYISISPCKTRFKVWNVANEANQKIKAYCQENEGLTFIDGTECLLDSDTKPKTGIFRWDGIHFNKKGYAIWNSLIKPFLVGKYK